MPSLTTAVTVGTAALMALPLLLLAAPGASPGCVGLADLTASAAASPDAAQPALDSAAPGQRPTTVTTTATPASVPIGASTAGTAPQRGWDTEQRAVAATVVAVGRSRGMPPRAVVVALATAMQESQLRNLPGGDADSIGVFQQRPSAGWGTPAQLASPTYQAGTFYTALAAIPGWQSMPLTQAAQAVQRSAHPDAYARWAGPALTLYQQQLTTQPAATIDGPPLAGDGDGAASGAGCGLPGGDGHADSGDVSLPAGFTLPPGNPTAVRTAVAWALKQLGTPYSYGGDCTDAHSGDPAHECDCSSLIILS